MLTYHSEEINFTLKTKTVVKDWVINTIEKAGKEVGEINIIFCKDDFLAKINKDFLAHDTFTDIITFDYTADNKKGHVTADLYISIERVKDNAEVFGKSFENELHRVIIHGTLHLLGFKDKSKIDKEKMTAMEDVCLREFEMMMREKRKLI